MKQCATFREWLKLVALITLVLSIPTFTFAVCLGLFFMQMGWL